MTEENSENKTQEAAEQPPAPAAAASPLTKTLKVAACTLQGALLGAMLLLGVLGFSARMEFAAYERFANWAGSQVHGVLQKPGMKKMMKVHGEDAEFNIPAIIQSKFVLQALIGRGLLAGGVLGLICGVVLLLVSRKKAPAAASPGLPRGLPLGLAVLGLCYNGYVWGNVAVLTLILGCRRGGAAPSPCCGLELPAGGGKRAGRVPWLTLATWVVSLVAVLGWAWAMETGWEDEGWSTQIPPKLKAFIYWAGHLFGMKE